LSGDAPSQQAVVGDEVLDLELVARRPPRLTLRFRDRQERFFAARVADTLYIQWRGLHYALKLARPLSVDTLDLDRAGAGHHADLRAPMSGTLIKLHVAEGAYVEAGQPLVVLEAMKMEHTVIAPHAGIVGKIHFAVGQLVPDGAILVEFEGDPNAEVERS